MAMDIDEDDQLYYATLADEDELDYELALDAAEAERERMELAYAYTYGDEAYAHEIDYMDWQPWEQE